MADTNGSEGTPSTGATGSTEARTRRRKVLIVAGIALLALFGASFAANIDINPGTEVEFGQGVEQIIACDSADVADGTPGVVVTLTSSDPEITSDSFQFSVSGIVVSDIDAQCLGKVLTVGLYDETGALKDEVVFDLDADALTGDAPYRAGANADDTTLGCEPGGTVPDFPDGSPFVAGNDCFPSSDGLQADIDASTVTYVSIETADPAI